MKSITQLRLKAGSNLAMLSPTMPGRESLTTHPASCPILRWFHRFHTTKQSLGSCVATAWLYTLSMGGKLASLQFQLRNFNQPSVK